MSDDKITYINRGKSNFEDELLKIANTLRESDAEHVEESVKTLLINGNNNVVGDGNTVNNLVALTRQVKRVVKVQTGDGVLDAQQKHKIKTMLYEWVDKYNALKKSNLTYNSAWIALNAAMGVNSYHEIKADQFEKAVKWLRSRLGTLHTMASAPKKVEDWRAKSIKSIQARCSEKGWQTWRKEFMAKKFGKSSLRDLTDTELKQLYQTVWNKK
ncbi:hypothetical protein DO692_04110 [Salmonella enterica subsp. enterica serovar Carmel]|nr:hypothetical protein [Salmonella enterica subsp. enterica serovar Carmel]